MTLDDLIYKPGLLAGRRYLVTGGGSGLGRVMSEALLLLGAEVYICGRSAPVVEQTAAELMAAIKQQFSVDATGRALQLVGIARMP